MPVYFECDGVGGLRTRRIPMALTTAQIRELIAAPPVIGIRRGQLQFLLSNVTRSRTSKGTLAQRALLTHLLDLQVTVSAEPAHPNGRPELQSGDGDRTLSASDVAWIQRLPADPDDITWKARRSPSTVRCSAPNRHR